MSIDEANKREFIFEHISEDDVEILARTIKQKRLSEKETRNTIKSAYCTTIVYLAENNKSYEKKRTIGRIMWDARHTIRKSLKNDPKHQSIISTLKEINALSTTLKNKIEDTYNQDSYFFVDIIDNKIMEIVKGDEDVRMEDIIPPLEILSSATEKLHSGYSEIQKNNDFRPSLKTFKEFVYSNIELYNKVSAQPFSFMRYKNDNGSYACITEGHQFVCNAVEILNKRTEPPYSDKNIVTAIESTQTQLKKSSR